MKKLVVIFGPPAVGKMTVGRELARLTGFPLFHNHLSVELVLPFFDFGTAQFGRLVYEFRRRILEEVAASEHLGLIFTYVWALDQASDKQFVDEITGIFESRGGQTYFVELEADLEERLRRNRTEERLRDKPSKPGLERSDRHLLESDQQYRLNSHGDFFYPERHLKVTNTHLDPGAVAGIAARHFGLTA